MMLPFKNNTYASKSDEELVNLYKSKRDSNIVSILYDRYAHLALGVSLKYLKDQPLAEDITMYVFEKLLKKLHLYDIQHFKSWLHSVVKNECMMVLRKKKIEYPHSEIIEKKNGAVMESFLDLHPSENADEEKINKLNSAIAKLSEEQKTCITLFYFSNHTYKEIAEKTGFNMKMVKSHIQNGKRNLKTHLTKNGKNIKS